MLEVRNFDVQKPANYEHFVHVWYETIVDPHLEISDINKKTTPVYYLRSLFL